MEGTVYLYKALGEARENCEECGIFLRREVPYCIKSLEDEYCECAWHCIHYVYYCYSCFHKLFEVLTKTKASCCNPDLNYCAVISDRELCRRK